MIDVELENLIKQDKALKEKYKVGWYLKDHVYRYLLQIDLNGYILYKSKTAMDKNSNTIWGVDSNTNTWFAEAQYLGDELRLVTPYIYSPEDFK